MTCCCSSPTCRLYGCQAAKQIGQSFGTYGPGVDWQRQMQSDQHASASRCECHSCTQYRASQTPFYKGPEPVEKKD